MKTMKALALASILGVVSVAAAHAGMCNYRLSSMIGASSATGVLATSTVIAASDVGIKAAGFYLITNATTGATMIGATAAGTSAAGTIGIIGGTSGTIGAAASIVTAPATAVAAGVITIAGLGMEAGCYFADERITDFKTVHELMKKAVENADPTQAGIIYQKGIGPWFWQRNPDGEVEAYQILNLYIVNGELMHRDQFLNTSLGFIAVKFED